MPQASLAEQDMLRQHDPEIINYGEQNYGSMPRAPLSAQRTGTTSRPSDMVTNPVTVEPTLTNNLPAPSPESDPVDYSNMDPQLWLSHDQLPENNATGEDEGCYGSWSSLF
jgi:hypothetical protein